MATRVEHLVVRWVPGFFAGNGKWTSDYHDNLGSDLQSVLTALEEEGWEAVFALPSTSSAHATQVVLKRPKPEPR